MSTLTGTNPSFSSENKILFKFPLSLRIDTGSRTLNYTSLKIETMIRELRERGPLMAFGSLGPQCYLSKPFQLKNAFCGKKIYGWVPGTRSLSAEKTYIAVVGASIINNVGFVYFKLSRDFAPDMHTFIKEYGPTDDSRVFISTFETLKQHLVNLYPPLSENNAQPSGFSLDSVQQQNYVLNLTCIPLNSILGDQKASCRAVGQEVFDKIKADQDSIEAGVGVLLLLEAIQLFAQDGLKRREYIEQAWEGIGDDIWQLPKITQPFKL